MADIAYLIGRDLPGMTGYSWSISLSLTYWVIERELEFAGRMCTRWALAADVIGVDTYTHKLYWGVGSSNI